MAIAQKTTPLINSLILTLTQIYKESSTASSTSATDKTASRGWLLFMLIIN